MFSLFFVYIVTMFWNCISKYVNIERSNVIKCTYGISVRSFFSFNVFSLKSCSTYYVIPVLWLNHHVDHGLYVDIKYCCIFSTLISMYKELTCLSIIFVSCFPSIFRNMFAFNFEESKTYLHALYRCVGK